MKVPRCRYIKTNGLICKSPSLNDRPYCYFHNRLHERHYIYQLHQTTIVSPATGGPLTISALEDPESVQLALSVVINALAAGDIDPQRARALLYGLQLAASNARRLRLEPCATWDFALETDPQSCNSYTAPAGEKVDI